MPIRARPAAAALGVLLAVVLPLLAGTAAAQGEARSFTLAADPELRDSGLIDHLLVRFTLKTQRRAVPVAEGAEVRLGAGAGPPLFERGGTVYGLGLADPGEAARMFADWLTSEVGQATVADFTPEDGPPFTPARAGAAQAAPVVFEGDAEAGRRLATLHCARCHAVTPEDRKKSIDSAPSFGALRAIPDWDRRFMAFYALAPHPALMRVEGVSPPFDPARPPTVEPVLLTLEEAEAIGAFAARIAPADLGAPVAHQ